MNIDEANKLCAAYKGGDMDLRGLTSAERRRVMDEWQPRRKGRA